MKTLYFVGLEVDDQAFHVTVINSKKIILKQGVRIKSDVGALKKFLKPFEGCLVGYEATYVGFTIARDLIKKGIGCKVIAPTSIAKAPMDRIKNDKIDSLRLARGLLRDEFSFVSIPSLDDESDRQVMRSRSFLVSQYADLKRHILSNCRAFGLDFKKETGAKSHWTATHRSWLDKQVKRLPRSARISLVIMIQQLESLERSIHSLDTEADQIAEAPRHEKRVKGLMLLKGVSKTTALTLVTEIHDIKRFNHPKMLASYIGLDVAEYSSGAKKRQFGITKMGNKRLRTGLVEACQMFSKSKAPSKRAKAQRAGAPPELIKIADRCQERLYKKGHRLLAREKPRNLVKVACAREMVGFVWEILQKAS